MSTAAIRIRKNYFLALWRVPALIIWMVVLPMIFMLARALGLPGHAGIPHLFHAGVRKILGLQVTISGECSQHRPTLFTSNHISYLDVFVLGHVRAYYIAKSEVASWPILGKFSKYQNTLFIERKAGRTRQQIELMQQHLVGGQSLILFAEGTSTDGTGVQSFKSSLFESANPPQASVPVAIQPVTVSYTHQGGQKMNQAMRDYYAWYATMPFASHFATLFVLKKVDIKVHFHPVCYFDQFETRKQCADHCQNLVAEKLAEFLNAH